MKYLLVFISCFFLTSCAGIKVPKHSFIDLNNLNEETAKRQIETYNDSVMQKTTIINSIVFSFRGKIMTAIGLTKIDSENKNFSVAGFDPMGVTLFKLQVENEQIISSYVIPQLGSTNLNKATEMISKDIARIYFNRRIDLEKISSIEINEHIVTIFTKSDSENDQYIFSGNPLKLASKSKYKNNNKLWSVDYYDYRSINNRHLPFKVFLKHYKYGYALEVETKEIKQ